MKKILKKDLNQLGVIVKHSRLKMNLTLEKLSKGICCVSYLSKLENGQIVADYNIVRKLFERLSLDLENILKLFEMSDLERTISGLFFGDKFDIALTYELVENSTFSIKTSLVKCVYYLQNNNYDLLSKELFEIQIIETKLQPLEKDLFYYIKIEESLNLNKLEEAVELFNNYTYSQELSDKMKYLVAEQKYKLSYLQKDDKVVSKYYSDLDRLYSGWIPQKRQLMNKLMLLEFETSFGDELRDIDKDVDFDQLINKFGMDYWYYYLMIFNNLKMYDRVIEKIEKFGLSSAKILAIKAIAIFNLNSSRKNKIFEEEVKEYRFTKDDLVHKNFIFYMIHKMNRRMEELHTELRNDLLIYSLSYFNKFYNAYYYDDYEKYLMNNSKYKEASNFFRKYRKTK